MTEVEYYEELIVCPNCHVALWGTVELTFPFKSYVQRCGCGHYIMESEWEPIKLNLKVEV